MDSNKQFWQILKQTQILRNPKKRLATFGQTKISYFFLSEIKGFKDRSRLRQGVVTAEKPKIITPDMFRNRFQGFGREAQAFSRWLSRNYGDSFRGLEYRFRNESKSVHVEHSPLKDLADQIGKRLESEESFHSAILKGPDQTWHIALMKFVVDECMASLADNLRELDEHGFFDTPEKPAENQRREIDSLFKKARADRSLIPLLGQKLRQNGLFREYEDQFFALFKD